MRLLNLFQEYKQSIRQIEFTCKARDGEFKASGNLVAAIIGHNQPFPVVTI